MTAGAVIFVSVLELGVGSLLFLRKAADCEELKADSERLAALAETDDLTGLRNRRAWFRMVRDVYPTEKRIGVIVWNLNGLREVNRSFGHAEGDRLLRRFGTALQTLESVNVQLYRISGDEFAAVTEGGDETLVRALLTRLEQHLYDETLASPVRISAEYAFTFGRGCEADRLLQNAEADIYNSRPV